MKIISGFAVHQHDLNLVEWCPDFKGRVKEIKKKNRAGEQEIRLRLFKMLSKKAIAALPESVKSTAIKCLKAQDEYSKVRNEWSRARDVYWEAEDVYWKPEVEYLKAWNEWSKAWNEWLKALDEYWEARDEWTDKESWHEKYCGCKEWNGKKIVFN